jgi:hypothetical protein
MGLIETSLSFVYCDPGATRTRDPQLRRLLLYPLSYGAKIKTNENLHLPYVNDLQGYFFI